MNSRPNDSASADGSSSDRSSTGSLLIGAGVGILAFPLVAWLFALVPSAWFLTGVLLVGAGIVHQAEGRGGHDDDGARTNCPSCGARTDVDADACEYCETPL